MKILELFSGTHSLGKVAQGRGHTVISVDIDGNATINEDILTWDYKKAYPVGYFDYIHASPECNTFSQCRKCWFGHPIKSLNPDWSIPDEEKVIFTKEIFLKEQLEKGVPLVERTLEIIDYFKPRYYTIENPKNGDMKKYIDRPFTDVEYCRYGFPYKKTTRIWNNFNFQGKLCNNECPFRIKNQHIQTCGTTRHVGGVEGLKAGSNNKAERYRIPPALCEAWLDCMTCPSPPNISFKELQEQTKGLKYSWTHDKDIIRLAVGQIV